MTVLSEREKLIEFVEMDDNFFKQMGSENAFVWEKSLISDYWKKWREEIRTTQNEEDAKLLAHKVLELRSLILWNTNAYKKGICNAERLKKSIETKEKELQSITKKEWDFVEKISKELDKFLEGIYSAKKGGWNKEELIREISELKAEIERLKGLEVSGDFEKVKVKEFSQRLEKYLKNSQMSLDSLQKTPGHKLPVLTLIGLISIFAMSVGFIILKNPFLKRKNQRKNARLTAR